MRTARAGHIEDCPAMPGPRDKRHRTRRSALLKRATGIPIRHRGGRTPGDARLNCGPASRIARPLHHHGRCRTNLKRRQAHNAGDQRLAALGDPHRRILSRVRCIALLWANPPLRRIIAPGQILPRCRQADNLGRTLLLTGTPDWPPSHQGQRFRRTRPRPAHQPA
jgi:hypothetical protein